MAQHYLFIVILGIAGVVPCLERPSVAKPAAVDGEVLWPTHFEGKALLRLELSEREAHFANAFPGHMARFHDGQREIIIRQVEQATRKLHPAAHCFRASGYQLQSMPLYKDSGGHLWACFDATKGDEAFYVYERITDDYGNQWTDVSSWYWACLLKKTSGPWQSYVVIERVAGGQ